jgi:hypothetical protein
LSDIQAVFPQVLRSETAGTLAELVQAYVDAAVAGIGAGNLSWRVISGAESLLANTGYAVNGLSLTSLILPAAVPNSRLILYAYSAAGFRLQQSDSLDQIQVGDKFTSLGVSGRIESKGQGSCIELNRLSERWVGNILQGYFEMI